jgi:hypothetical protein
MESYSKAAMERAMKVQEVFCARVDTRSAPENMLAFSHDTNRQAL